MELTENQLLFLKNAIAKEEVDQVIGYTDSNGQPSESDKEIMKLINFLNDLRPGQELIKG